MTICEKVAYLKGLKDGLGLDTEASKEGKLISAIIDILEEVGMSIEDLEESTEALGEELDAVSDDLADVEEYLLEDDDEEEDDDEDDEDGCSCGCEDEDFFEMECPNCEETLVIDSAVLESGSVQCPNCKEKFTIDLSDEGCDCGCDCGCEEEE